MAIRVLFFAFAAERMKAREIELPSVPGMTVREVFRRFEGALGVPIDRFVFAVNDEWAPADHGLVDGDTLALIPPMSGG